MESKLGIIAGGGDVPARIVNSCMSQGRAHFLLALKGHAEAAQLPRPPDAWIRLGEAGKGLSLLRAAGAMELVMAGRVTRPSLLSLRPDRWSAKQIVKLGLRSLGDDGLLRSLIGAIEAEGFRVVPVEQVVESLLVEARFYGAVRPDEQAQADIATGVRIAKGIGALDIGQAVVVQQGYVLGVEAAEGTDNLIRRCAELSLDGDGGVLVKLTKPGQDRRIDLPTIGPRTVKLAAESRLRGIAVEAGGALIVDIDGVAEAADKAGLFVQGIRVDK